MANILLSDIYDTVAQDAYTTPEYDTDQFLKDIHRVTQDFWSEVVWLRKADWNWDIWLTDTVSLQSEYTDPPVTSTSVWAAYIDSVAVTYDSTTYTDTGLIDYTVAKRATDAQIANWNWYLENQPNNLPLFFERDGSVFIAPDPRSNEVGTNRLQIKGIRSIASGSWTLSTSETEIKMPVFCLTVLEFGCIWKAHVFERRDRGVILDAKTEYENEKRTAINKIFVDKVFLNSYPPDWNWNTTYGNNSIFPLTWQQ